ncbi:hypothetical protein OH764_32400 (plasmid) [Burkholderia sp. M6-3]
MKKNIFVLAAAAASIHAFADCRSVLLDSDKASDVRQNLQCLANQVIDLKNQLASAQAALQTMQTEKNQGPHIGFGMHPQRFPSPAACHTWAMGYLNNNGFSDVTQYGQAGATGQKLPIKAILLCTPTGELALYLAGPDQNALQALESIFDAAFSQTFSQNPAHQ